MAKATIVRPVCPAKPATPEVKIEGVPYQSAKPARPADPGEIQLTLTYREAMALRVQLGVYCGTLPETLVVFNALFTVGVPSRHDKANPFTRDSHAAVALIEKPTA